MRPHGLALKIEALPRPRGPGRLLRAARIVHPFPTLLNVAATAALACIAAGGVPQSRRLATLLLVMLAAQSCIGVTNDIFDRDLDARTKPWKPLAASLISIRVAAALAAGLAAASVTLGATLGWKGCALAVLGLSCGLAYDVRLKRTPLSAVPYMIGIPVLPLWVWVVAGSWRAALWWLLPMGALIGLALHLANTLPDLDDDAANGVRGLTHRLGARLAMLLAWASFAAALALSAAIAPLVEYHGRIYVPAATFGAASLAVTMAMYGARRDRLALQYGFAILGVGSAVLAAGWLAAI